MMVRPAAPRIWFNATPMFAIFTKQIPAFVQPVTMACGVAAAKDAQINGYN